MSNELLTREEVEDKLKEIIKMNPECVEWAKGLEIRDPVNISDIRKKVAEMLEKQRVIKE